MKSQIILFDWSLLFFLIVKNYFFETLELYRLQIIMFLDVLAAPKSFPTPVTRYTLCDMSIVWQMFGGNDFTKNVKEDQKKEVRFADRQLGDSVSFSTKDRSKVHFKKSEGVCVQDLSWIQKGGVNRDHTVLMELKLSKVMG